MFIPKVENLFFDIEIPSNFVLDIKNNLLNLINDDYIGHFKNNHFYLELIDILNYSDVVIQKNNTGKGSISVNVKFLIIEFAPESYLFNLKKIRGAGEENMLLISNINKTDNSNELSTIKKNIIKNMVEQNKLNILIYNSNDQENIPIVKIKEIVTNKSSSDVCIVEKINSIGPIMLKFNLEEIINNNYNKEFIRKLELDFDYNKMFDEVKKNEGKFYLYEKGKIYENVDVDNELLSYDFRHIDNKDELILKMKYIIYNYIC